MVTKIIIMACVFLGTFFALPAFFPGVSGVAFTIGTLGVRYVYLVTAGALGLTYKAVD